MGPTRTTGADEDDEDKDVGDKKKHHHSTLGSVVKAVTKSLTHKKTSSSLVLPGCDLAKAKTMEDLNDCVAGFLTESKKAGSYESNLAQSLTEGTVLSPEDTQTKIDAD